MMAKKINANYAFVFYDVNVKRVHKVFKVCKKYLTHYQNFRFPWAYHSVKYHENEERNRNSYQ